MTTAISDLLERVEKATGPDGQIDVDILAFVVGVRIDGSTTIPREIIPRFTASIDAALALVERKLGTDALSMLYNFDLGWHASAWAEMAFTANLHVAVGTPPEMKEFHGQSYTMPLAILTALLRALESETPA